METLLLRFDARLRLLARFALTALDIFRRFSAPTKRFIFTFKRFKFEIVAVDVRFYA